MEETERRFVADILAAPDDDAPRLVYADWLLERGDPRGQFIRLQIECANAESLRRTYELERELLELLHAHEELGSVWETEFSRGFLHRIVEHPKRFAETANQIFEAAPLLGQLWLNSPDGDGCYQAFAKTPELSRLRELDIHRATSTGRVETADWEIRDYSDVPSPPQFHRHSDEILHALAEHAELSSLRALRFRGGGAPTHKGVRAFFSSDRAPDLAGFQVMERSFDDEALEALLAGGRPLKNLFLGYTGISGAGVQDLLHQPSFRAIETLNLTHVALSSEDLLAIATSPHRASLRELHLAGTKITDDGLTEFVEAGGLRGLERLVVSHNELGSSCVEAIAGNSDAASLHGLEMSFCKLDTTAGQTLGGSRHLNNVRRLDLGSSELAGDGAAALLSLPKLEALEIANTGLHVKSQTFAKALADTHLEFLAVSGVGSADAVMSRPSSLRRLHLRSAPHETDAARRVAECGNLEHLEELTLYAAVGDEGLVALASTEQLPRLVTARLRGAITDEGVERAVSEPNIARLLVLDLRLNKVTERGAQACNESKYLEQLRYIGIWDPEKRDRTRIEALSRFGKRAWVPYL